VSRRATAKRNALLFIVPPLVSAARRSSRGEQSNASRTAVPVTTVQRMAYTPVPLDWERLDPDDALARSRAFLETMRARRSVRMFSSDPVPRELIDNALEVAGTAPSGAHQQPWTFAVVSDAALKARVREAAEVEERDFYERRATDEWKQAIDPIGTDWVKTHITDAPYVIVVFEQAWRPGANGEKIKHYYVRESVGIAVGYLLAALQVAGLYALTHTPSPMKFLGELLDRPANERPFILIPVGYPAADAVVPDLARKPLHEIVARYEAPESGPAAPVRIRP
jgi:iodotyrosine deiodinase